ncbi:regulator of polyketide synthase expression [Streptomyces sp. SA15]|uniref:PucR family transcriptional regulator n=1 Tax=Streptomyces sp. SA15 TaxID=934019 RepID=UPI000BAF4A72|nr:PucR family transcriptional regulator [Streptomyces sp. SA15]PAZ15519.1 regulator of polyketide synthase expression [Streptomyces sp. SA15]
MAVTVGELLAMPHLQMSLHAGARGLDREVSWVHPSDLPNPWAWLASGELLLTNGTGLAADSQGQASFIERLAEAGPSAFGLGLGTGGPPLTRALTDRADELSLPVVSVPYSVPFSAVVRAVADVNEDEGARQLAGVARLYALLRTSMARGLSGPEMFGRLGRELDARLYLVDPATGLSLFEEGPETSFADALAAEFAAHSQAMPGVLRLRRRESGSRWAVALAVAVPGDQPTALVAEPTGEQLPSLGLLQHVATVGALELTQLAADRESRRRRGAELLRQLLEHRLDPTAAEYQLADSGIALADSVLLLTPAACDSVADEVHRRLSRLRVPHLLLRRDDSLHIVMDDRPERLEQILRGSSAPIGVSDRIGSAGRIPEARQEAHWALGAAKAENRRVVRYGDETALPLPRTPAEAQVLVSRVLGALMAHDAEHDTEYLHTLRVTLRRNRSWQLAADELHIHKQTLGYRLRKIEQLTGRGVTQTDHIAELWFAIRAHDLVHSRGTPRG